MYKIVEFKSNKKFFQKEMDGYKNNTVRTIDFTDRRFINLLDWCVEGYKMGDIKIKIIKAENKRKFFVRDIQDISVWNDFMIITWNPITIQWRETMSK